MMESIKRVARKIKNKRMIKSYPNLINHNAWMRHYDGYYSHFLEPSKLLEKIAGEYKAIQETIDKKSSKKILSVVMVPGVATLMKRQYFVDLSLRLRGAEVDYFVCDGLDTQCAFGRVLQPRPSCKDCTEYGELFLRHLPGKKIRLSGFSSQEKIDNLREKIFSLSLDDCKRFVHRDIFIGKSICYAMTNYFLSCNLREGPLVLKKYREMLFTDCVTMDAFFEFLEQNDYDAVVVPGGAGAGYNAILQVCFKKGIPCNIWEVWEGANLNSVVWVHNDIAAHFTVFDSKKDLDNYTISDKELAKVKDYFHERVVGSPNTFSYNKGKQANLRYLKERLAIEDDDSVFLLLTTLPWDANAFDRDKIFNSQYEWIKETIDYLANKRDLKLLIRAHPAETHESINPYRHTQERIIDYLHRYYEKLPKNIQFIAPDDDINTYGLMELTNAALIYCTTTVFELILRRIPTIVVADTHYSNMGFTLDPNDKREYFKMLDDIDKFPVSDAQVDRAMKYAYKYLFMRILPYDKIHEARSLDDLKPGKDTSLDAICDGILKGTEFSLK